MIKRREFITLLGGAAAWPFAAQAQQQALTIRRIGFLVPGSARAPVTQFLLDAFRQGLFEYGWVEGQNLRIEYRFAEGSQAQLPQLALELARLELEVIVAEGTPAIQSARSVARAVPIVMATSADPVRSGFIANLNRPDGNITGSTTISRELIGKRLELLAEVVPGVARVAVLWNSSNPATVFALEQTQASAQSLSIPLIPVDARTPDQLENAFGVIAAARPSALMTMPDGMFHSQAPRIVKLTSAIRLPGMFPDKQFVVEGGLIAYGPSVSALYRRAATYVDRILRGANAADLPVEQPTKFDLIINLKTAKTLGLTVPLIMQMTADEVIE
jgi:putative tryptophan/tyrosine transport system substrate-binding protein